LRTAFRQRQSAIALLSAAEESYEAALESYNHGVRNLLDVTAAQRTLAQARSTDVLARTQVLASLAELAFRTADSLQQTRRKPDHEKELFSVSGQSQRDCVLQPGLGACELPWERAGQMRSTPTGLRHWVADADAAPVGLKAQPHRFPRVARRLATLGSLAESLWDSAMGPSCCPFFSPAAAGAPSFDIVGSFFPAVADMPSRRHLLAGIAHWLLTRG